MGTIFSVKKLKINIYRRGASSCEDCDVGRWSDAEGATSSSTCLQCYVDANVHCAAGTAVPWVGSGLYRNFPDPGIIVPCYPPEACAPAKLGNTSCTEGYEGLYCASCDENHFRNGGKCLRCMNKVGRWIIMVGSFVLLLTAFAKLSEHQHMIPHSLRILLLWIQFLSLFPSLSSAWPPILLDFLNGMSVFNLDIGYLGLGCDLKSSYFTILRLKLLMPIFLTCHGIVLRCLGKHQQFQIRRVLAYSLFVTAFFSIQLLNSMFQAFNCVMNGPNFYVVALDPSVRCYDSAWTNFLGFAIFFIFLYLICIPLALLLSFFRVRTLNDLENWNSLVHPLVQFYRPETRWFEVARILLKVSFVVI